ncbi:hypothetical protein KBY55_23495 [Streptomyces sp. b94]|nr:hypothetical protein [Streptomyces sp. b94]MBQ1098940.1 hypothetical protein [Streptomyces sp. b94]
MGGRRRAVPWLVLGLWIAVLAIASPFASGRLSRAPEEPVPAGEREPVGV